MTHIRFAGEKHPHHGPTLEGDTFVAYGWLCDEHKNTTHDKRVSIYHRAEVGYTYKDRA